MKKFLVQTTLVQTATWMGPLSANVAKEVEATDYKVGDNGDLMFYEMGKMSAPIATFASGAWVWVEEVGEDFDDA